MGYTISLNIKDRLCVIIGGGRAAYIKAKGLNEAGIRPRIVAPEFCDEIRTLNAEFIERKYSPVDMHNAFLVFALTNDESLNRQIRKTAVYNGALLCGEDFTVPAARSGENISVSVSTGCPQLSAAFADTLLKYDGKCGELRQYRAKLLASDLDDEEKRMRLAEAVKQAFSL